MSNEKEKVIALFDSGMGGISVLRSVMKELPDENYIYYGDSAHTPWGNRTSEEIVRFSDEITEKLICHDAKCIIIACNTATSRAAAFLREKYRNVPIIGIEPAVKPAAESREHPKILVLATQSTIKGQKLADLVEKYREQADIDLVAAPELVTFVESGITDVNVSEECRRYIGDLTDPYQDCDGVVLGCTHFPFLRKTIMENFPESTKCFDGAEGVARNTKRILKEKGLLRVSDPETFTRGGNVTFFNSDPGKLELMKLLLNA